MGVAILCRSPNSMFAVTNVSLNRCGDEMNTPNHKYSIRKKFAIDKYCYC